MQRRYRSRGTRATCHVRFVVKRIRYSVTRCSLEEGKKRKEGKERNKHLGRICFARGGREKSLSGGQEAVGERKRRRRKEEEKERGREEKRSEEKRKKGRQMTRGTWPGHL